MNIGFQRNMDPAGCISRRIAALLLSDILLRKDYSNLLQKKEIRIYDTAFLHLLVWRNALYQ